MGWGADFVNAVKGAPAKAREAVAAAGRTAKSAYDYAERKAVEAYEYSKDKAVEGYQYGKEKAVEGYEYSKDKIVEGYDYTKDRAVQGYQAGKQAVGDAYQAGKNIAAQAVRDVIESRYENARKSLGQCEAGSPVGSCPTALAKCKKLKEALNKAEISADTYNDSPPENGGLVGGYKRLNPDDPVDAKELSEKLGIDKRDLEPEGSDFRSRVYKRAVNGQTEYVVGFRGTQTGADWLENLKQGTGMNEGSENDPGSKSSYGRAKDLAMEVSERAERSGSSVSYTGHSLGGGLASAASVVTGSPASTYNAAGLNAHTVGGAYPKTPSPVDAYYTPTDPLSALQDNRGLVLGGITGSTSAIPGVGTAVAGGLTGWLAHNEVDGTPVMPQAYGDRYIVPFPKGASIPGPIEGHGMELVIDGIKEERKTLGC